MRQAIEHRSPVDGSSGASDYMNMATVQLGWTLDKNALNERMQTVGQTSCIERKTFSNSTAGSVTDGNKVLFVLFSPNVVFRLNEILMLLLSCLSIIFLLFLCICARYKK